MPVIYRIGLIVIFAFLVAAPLLAKRVDLYVLYVDFALRKETMRKLAEVTSAKNAVFVVFQFFAKKQGVTFTFEPIISVLNSILRKFLTLIVMEVCTLFLVLICITTKNEQSFIYAYPHRSLCYRPFISSIPTSENFKHL